MSLAYGKKVWLGLVILLVSLFLAAWLMLKSIFEYELAQADKEASSQTEFFKQFIRDRLQLKDFQIARGMITTFGSHAPDIMDITLTSKNGFVIAEYHRNTETNHFIKKEASFNYSYTGNATLTVRVNIDRVYTNLNNRRLLFYSGYSIVALFMIYLVFINQKVRNQGELLEQENRRRLAAEEELIIHRDQLQSMVKERTKELELIRDQAVSANRAKSDFLANMSHELRTPLNSIIGFVALIKDERVGSLNEKQKQQLNIVHRSSEHLLQLINDILDLSKIEAGKMEVYETRFSLREVLEELRTMMLPQAEDKHIRIQLDIEKDLDNIVTDKSKLMQAVLNLLSNAVKFTEIGGVYIQASSDAQKIYISVKDTGSGISNENITKIFNSFSQIESGFSRKHQGTGLGLSVAKRCIQLIGGDVTVHSVLGMGSEFTIWVPKNLPSKATSSNTA